MIKRCQLCGKEFQAKTNKKYCGHRNDKNSCSYKVYRKQSNERNKQWKKRNPEKVKKRRRKYYQEHPEKIRKAEKRWRGKNRDILKERRLKLRFQIFQKDNFTCHYCGRKPPECVLEIDHRFPKSKGGKDNINNYITSCRECNIGKRDIILKEFKS